MRFTAWAGPGFTGHENYAPDAFDNCLGKVVPVKVDGEWVADATVIGVEVVNGKGRGLYLTFEVNEQPKRGVVASLVTQVLTEAGLKPR